MPRVLEKILNVFFYPCLPPSSSWLSSSWTSWSPPCSGRLCWRTSWTTSSMCSATRPAATCARWKSHHHILLSWRHPNMIIIHPAPRTALFVCPSVRFLFGFQQNGQKRPKLAGLDHTACAPWRGVKDKFKRRPKGLLLKAGARRAPILLISFLAL